MGYLGRLRLVERHRLLQVIEGGGELAPKKQGGTQGAMRFQLVYLVTETLGQRQKAFSQLPGFLMRPAYHIKPPQAGEHRQELSRLFNLLA